MFILYCDAANKLVIYLVSVVCELLKKREVKVEQLETVRKDPEMITQAELIDEAPRVSGLTSRLYLTSLVPKRYSI